METYLNKPEVKKRTFSLSKMLREAAIILV